MKEALHSTYVPRRHLFGTLLPQIAGLGLGAIGLAICAAGIHRGSRQPQGRA
jgi:hypothetical protein